MEIIRWANGNGQTIQLDKEEAKELKHLIGKALIQGKAESSLFFIPTEVEIV